MPSASDVRWTPFAEPLDWFAGVDPGTGLAGIIMRLLHVLRFKNQMLSVSLTTTADLTRQLAAARRRNQALIDEIRAMRREAA
jgi:hypothetical protein